LPYGADDYTGDGGAATSAALGLPVDVSVTIDGTLYITEWTNRRIRKVTADGIISTVAGGGTATSSGDRGPAVGAGFSYPQWSAVSPGGDLYINVQSNHRIRKVSPPAPGVEGGRHARSVSRRPGALCL
jgi:hypothetical protein